MMQVLLVILFLLFLILLFIRWTWKRIEMTRLYRMFGIENNKDSFDDINKEYYKTIIEPEFVEQTIYDLEINNIFDKINRTYTDVGREYLYGRFFQSSHNELFDKILQKINDKTILKKVIYNLYDLSKNYSESLSMFDDMDFLSKYEYIFIICLGCVPILFVPLYFVMKEQLISVIFLWMGFQTYIYTLFKENESCIKESIWLLSFSTNSQ